MKTAIGILALLCAAAAFAQPQQSENFRITKSVLDAGGGVSTSTNFRLTSAFGQPTPIGVSSSANFVLSAGFLSPQFAASPLSPITNLVIKRQAMPSANMQLDWGTVAGAVLYTIYRDTVATFTPSAGNQVGTSITNSFVDVGAVNLTRPKYFYIVTSTSAGEPGLARAPENGDLKQKGAVTNLESPSPAPSPPAKAVPGDKLKRRTER